MRYDLESATVAERAFHKAMLNLYRSVGVEAHYWANYFLRMVRRIGGLEAASRLLAKEGTSKGFEGIYQAHKLDLSVEWQVLLEEFAHLFTPEHRDLARKRLIAHDCAPPTW